MAHRVARAAVSLLTAFSLVSMSGCATDEGGGPGSSSVEATLVSATLADDCGGGGGGLADAPGACAEDAPCPSFCRQTSVQLHFDATELDTDVPVEIVGVRLIDMATGNAVDTLEARNPQQWQNESYVPWDGQLAAGSELRASFALSAPDWGALGTGGSGRFGAYDARYVIELTVRIDGVDRKIRSEELAREPEIVT